jgi:hypothetical protein
MTELMLFVGLDIHKKTISVAMVEGSPGATVRFYGTIANTPDSLRTLCRKLSRDGQQLHFCYEDGVIPARRYRFRETRRILRRDGASSHHREDPPCISSASMFR